MKVAAAQQKFLRYMRDVKQASIYTLRNYRRSLNLLTTVVGADANLEDITLDTLDALSDAVFEKKSKQGGRISRRTQHIYLIPIRSFVRHCIKRGYDEIGVSPDQIELPKLDPTDVSGLTEDELNRLREVTEINPTIDARDRGLIELLYSTGLRVGELQGLNREQINLKTGEFSIIGKGKKVRTVYLTERAKQMLQHYFSTRTDDFRPLFISSKTRKAPTTTGEHRRLSMVSIEKMVRERARKAGLTRKVTPHTLRHTFATTLLRNGADLRSVQELLGHARIATTQIYTHVTNPQLKDAHTKFLS